MTQFEVMINLAGIKTKEGEDFVKVVKEISVPGNSRWLWNECAIFLENGSVCSVSTHSVRYNAGMSLGMFGDKIYNFDTVSRDNTFWSEFRRAMTEIAGLYEF